MRRLTGAGHCVLTLSVAALVASSPFGLESEWGS